MKSHLYRDLVLINAAGFVRLLGVDLTGVVMGIYLFRVGLSPFSIGLVIAAGLAGSAFGNDPRELRGGSMAPNRGGRNSSITRQ